jgi:Zinc dependent phospholipase C
MKCFVGVRLAILVSMVVVSSRALAWGEVAHGMIATAGVNLTTNGQSFFQANVNNFATLTTVPDVVWKSGKTESGETPNHWFQVDYYFPSLSINDIETFPKSYSTAVSQYGQSTVLAQGTAPWRVKQFYDLAVQALKSGDNEAAMQYMGVMSHYIADMSQPLHDSEDYDGAMENNGKATGIHLFFETTNIVKNPSATVQAAVQSQAETLLSDATFTAQFTGDIFDVLFHEVARAIVYRDQILNTDKSEGRTGQGAADQLTLAESRMADGAATLALILDHLWSDAGLTSSPGAITASTPSWIAPNFARLSPTPWLAPYTPTNLRDDDCAR